jgi:ribonuclease J
MHVCIHRGTHEIGGTCVEIECQGKRIVLDIGLPLDADAGSVSLPPVAGFREPDESLLGVVISHPHQDHFGLAGKLPAQTPFLMGAAAHRILDAALPFMPKGVAFRNVSHLHNRRQVVLGRFRLTPYLVDHSAYDAYSVLVEADGKRLFYTGDFRAHGYKGRLFEDLIESPPRGIDVLLMEGTTLGRSPGDEDCQTEAQLVDKMVALIKATPGMVLVCCSGQNIDRLVTVLKAANKTRRQFIMDGYTAHMLRATGRKTVPQADWKGVRVFWPKNLRLRILRSRRFEIVDKLPCHRIFPEELASAAPSSVMLFRPSMKQDLEYAKCLDGASVIYSMWPGYLKGDGMKSFLAWLLGRGIPLHRCHTSGHASPVDLQRFAKALAPGLIVPVHSSEPERFREFFKNVEIKEDGQWWEAHYG